MLKHIYYRTKFHLKGRDKIPRCGFASLGEGRKGQRGRAFSSLFTRAYVKEIIIAQSFILQGLIELKMPPPPPPPPPRSTQELNSCLKLFLPIHMFKKIIIV